MNCDMAFGNRFFIRASLSELEISLLLAAIDEAECFENE